MQTHHPISPPLSHAGDHKTSFNEGPHNSNESPFLRAQHTPESAFGELQDDQKLAPRTLEVNIEMDNAALSRAMEPYPSTNVYAPASQNDYAQFTSIPQPQFFGTSQPAMSVTPAAAANTTSAEGMTDNSAHLIHPNALLVPTVSQRHAARTRVEKPARVRKPKPKKKTPKSGKSALNSSVPLSELTKDLGGAIDDTEAFVNRSADVRHEEVQKRRQRTIPRPMNSFMLYRRAFSEKAKEWCAQNNHQIVSKATAESWAIESKSIRDFFNRMAAVERDNHRKAHPTYKFTPNKNGNVSKKARKKDEEDEVMSEADDLEYDMLTDADHLAMNSGQLTCDGCIHSRTPTPFEPDSSYGSRHASPFDQGRSTLYQPSEVNKSSWVNVNPGRPVPGMFSSPEQSHYYQSSIQQSSLGPNIEDVTYRRMNVPGGAGIQYDTSGALTGIPGGPHPELLQPQPQLTSHAGTPGSMENAQVDPQLLHANGLGIDLSQGQDGQFAPQNLDPWQPFPENQPHYTHSTSNSTAVRTQNGGDQCFAQPGYHYPALATGLDGGEIWGDAQVGVAPAGFDEWINGQSAY